ncbi:hypothetical protein Bca4012_089898 [Brassica carinata]
MISIATAEKTSHPRFSHLLHSLPDVSSPSVRARAISESRDCPHNSLGDFIVTDHQLNSTSRHISQHHHSPTNTQANNLFGTHDLNTRLRISNSSVNVYFRHTFKLNLLFIRHEFAVDSLIVRHEFTETRLWLGMSLQKLSFY